MKSKWLIISFLSICVSSTSTFAKDINRIDFNKVSCPSVEEIKGKKLDTVINLHENEFLVSIRNTALQGALDGKYRVWDVNIHTNAMPEDFNTAFAKGKIAMQSINKLDTPFAKSCGIYCYYCSYLDQDNDIVTTTITNTDGIIPLDVKNQ